MTDYWLPIPEAHGALPLAGGWLRFSRLERLRRDGTPEIVAASAAPDVVVERLTAPRPDLLGLSMDQPRLMGIVNATPDSFSDGGRYDPLAQARLLHEAGADILDIGGESTRPGASDVPEDTEISRVVPVISNVAAQVAVSVDTRKSRVAEAALTAGARMVNDVSGLDHDPALASVVARTGAALCLMHAQGVPATMQDNPSYDNVLLDVYDALEARVAQAEQAGISRALIAVDPGIGFGKTREHNLAILRRIGLFHGLGCAVLLGVSRKGFIGHIGVAPEPQDRMPGTLAVTLAAVAQGVQIHRVHDVAAHRQGLALWNAVTRGNDR